MGCDNCKVQDSTTKDPIMVPLVAVEGQGFRREKTLRGTVITFCAAMLVISILVGVFVWFSYRLQTQTMEKIESINRYWIDFIREYDFENYSYEYSQDGRGLNIIGDGNGVTNYGPEAESESEIDAPEGRQGEGKNG